MESIKEKLGIKVVFQIGFTFMFMFQAYQSLNKYLEYPVVHQTSTISTASIEKPWFYICPTHRYYYAESRNQGYHYSIDILMGQLKGSITPTWKGLHGNLTFKKLSGILFNKLHGGVNVTQTYEEVFLFFQGFCWKTYAPSIGITTNEMDITIFYLHPTSDLAVTFDKGPSHRIYLHVGQDKSYKYLRYEISYEVHDQTIHEGYSCVDYRKQTESYGDCILRNFKEYALSVFGCYPPWFDDTTGKVCEEDIVAKEIKNGTYKNIYADIDLLIEGSKIKTMANCIQPCYIVKTKLTEKVFITNYTEMSELKITTKEDGATLIKDAYSFDIFALIVELGSALGLWLGNTLKDFFI